MQSIIDYFSNVPDSHRIILLGLSLILFWIIEKQFPVTLNYKKWKHALVNSLFIIPDALVQLLLGFMVVKDRKSVV